MGESRQEGRSGPDHKKACRPSEELGLSPKGDGFLMTQSDFCFSCYVDAD